MKYFSIFKFIKKNQLWTLARNIYHFKLPDYWNQNIQLNRKCKIVQFQGKKLKNATYLALHWYAWNFNKLYNTRYKLFTPYWFSKFALQSNFHVWLPPINEHYLFAFWVFGKVELHYTPQNNANTAHQGN